jgi:hypothetical protein
MKKTHLLILAVPVVLLALVLALFPIGIKWYILKNSREIIGRQITVDKIRFNYLNGGVRVQNFKLYETDGTSEFAGIDNFEMNLGLLGLLKRNIVLSSVHIDGLRANILQDGDRFNFSDLLYRFSDSTDIDTDTVNVAAEPSFMDHWTLTVKNFQVSNTGLLYRDLKYKEEIGFEDIRFLLPVFTLGDSSSTADLYLNFESGGSLTTRFELDMDAERFTLEIDIDSMSMEPLNLMIAKNSAYRIQDVSGRFSQHVLIEGNPGHLLQSTSSGDVEIESFSLIDQRGQEFFSCRFMYMRFDTINWHDKTLLVNHLIIDEPRIKVELLEEGNTLGYLIDLPDTIDIGSQQTLNKEDAAEEIAIEQMARDAGALSEYTAMLLHLEEYTYRIDSVVILNGDYQIIDRTQPGNFLFEVSHHHLRAEAIGSGRESLYNEALINRQGRVFLDVKRIPEQEFAVDVEYRLNNLDLQQFTPYFVHYTGNPVERGVLQMYTTANVRGSLITSENAIDFNDISFGKKQKKGVYKIPMRFAASILRNPAGHIELDIPVKGNVDDPEFKIGKEIVQAILNVAFNVVASPIKALARMFNKDPEELREIDYEYLSTGLLQEETNRLKDLREILEAKPGINIDVIQCGDYQRALNKYALYKAKSLYYLEELIDSAGVALTSADSVHIQNIADDDTLFVEYINRKIADRELNIEEKSIELIGASTVQVALDSLFELRNEYIRSYFTKTSGLDSMRINVVSARHDTLSTENRRPFFLVNIVPPEE